MRMSEVRTRPAADLYEYQNDILQGVSRTFALTIPQLPTPLRGVVTNAYLLCRIADTIEDESSLDAGQKQHFHDFLLRVVAGDADAAVFAVELSPLLRVDATPAEIELIDHTPDVIAVTARFTDVQRRALHECLLAMCTGMPHFERHASVDGLRDEQSLDEYCYYVAGVVGEMLTQLFCDYSQTIASHCKQMLKLGVSFGKGLQMVNILKDFWEDRQRGVCWLPRNLFADAGLALRNISKDHHDPAFPKVYAHLLGVAHAHLRNGLRYTLLIPKSETGIRRFCLLALALAVQTLQCIHERPDFTSGDQVKVTRAVVTKTLLKTRLLAAHNRALQRWFARMGRGLPIEAALVPAVRHGERFAH